MTDRAVDGEKECAMRGCGMRGIPQEGHLIYVCPNCMAKAEAAIAKRIGKLYARHANN